MAEMLGMELGVFHIRKVKALRVAKRWHNQHVVHSQ